MRTHARTSAYRSLRRARHHTHTHIFTHTHASHTGTRSRVNAGYAKKIHRQTLFLNSCQMRWKFRRCRQLSFANVSPLPEESSKSYREYTFYLPITSNLTAAHPYRHHPYVTAARPSPTDPLTPSCPLTPDGSQHAHSNGPYRTFDWPFGRLISCPQTNGSGVLSIFQSSMEVSNTRINENAAESQADVLKSEDHQKLLEYGIHESVADRLDEIYKSGKIMTYDDIWCSWIWQFLNIR